MILNKFSIGDSISASFTYKVTEFSYGENYKFLMSDNRMYINTGKNTFPIFIDEADSSSSEFLRFFKTSEHPIVKITRHVKAQKKLYVLLFVYFENHKEDTFYMYYSNDFSREIFSRTNTPVDAFIHEEFVLNGNIFYQPNVSNDVINIIGNSYTLTAQRVENNLVRLDALAKQRRRPDYNISKLHFENLKVQKIDDYLREMQKRSHTQLSKLKEVKYVEFWQAYLKVEKNQTIIDLYERGSYSFEGRTIVGDKIQFKISAENPDSIHFEKGMMISFYSKPISKLIKYFYKGKEYTAYEDQINQEYELDIKESDEITVGIVHAIHENVVEVTIREKDMLRVSGIPNKGYLADSYIGSKINYDRKEKILKQLRDKGSFFLQNIILYGSLIGLEKEQVRVSKNTVKSDTLVAMFGRDDISPTDNQKEAIRLALTTPDIALIQGPPGTGKTTIIKGLISRIKTLHTYSPRILVATEQHEALHNVVDDVNTEIPPTIISFRQTDEEQDKLSTITAYQSKLTNIFQDYLEQVEYEDVSKTLYEFIITAMDKNYDKNYILSKIDDISKIILELDDNDLIKSLKVIELNAQKNDTLVIYKDELLALLLSSQLTEADSYADNGEEKLMDLLTYLEMDHIKDYTKLEGIKSTLDKDPDAFLRYREFVDELQAANKVHEDLESQPQSLKVLFQQFAEDIEVYLNKLSQSNVEGVIKSFLNDISNPYILQDTIQRYNSIFGSTCQQSDKFSRSITSTQKFDYVIVDEASRVNPVDLLIPMSMGHKVILVGDHKQLPHYLERHNIKHLANSIKSKDEVLYEVLSESLFERIFNLLKAESKLKRTITLSEQYRMNPVLGSFISKTFYDGAIKNGANVYDKKNHYGIFNNKNVAWIDISKSNGLEIRDKANTLYRSSEVEAIIQSLKDVAQKRNDGSEDFPNVGVISYYKAQTEQLQQRVNETFPASINDKITIGTVDSFQGKEFDIVFLSVVRANNQKDIKKRIGFLYNSPNRINVSMSRAKNLLAVFADSDTIAENADGTINPYFSSFLKLCKEEGYYEQKEV